MSRGWKFSEDASGHSRVVWRYNFICRPTLLQPVFHRIGTWLLQRGMVRRLVAFVRASADDFILRDVELFDHNKARDFARETDPGERTRHETSLVRPTRGSASDLISLFYGE